MDWWAGLTGFELVVWFAVDLALAGGVVDYLVETEAAEAVEVVFEGGFE